MDISDDYNAPDSRGAARAHEHRTRIAELEELSGTFNAAFQASEMRLAQARQCIRNVAALVDPVRDLHPDYSIPSIRQTINEYIREISQ